MPEELIEAPVEPVVEPEPFTLPEDFATTVQGWDVPIEQLGDAVQQYKSLQTEDGVVEAFIATGQSLGFGLKDLNRLFQDEVAPAPAAPAAPVAPVEPADPEELLSRAQVESMLSDVRREQRSFVEQQQQAQIQARQAQTLQGIDGWFDQAGVEGEQTRKLIASFGEKHILPNQDPYDMKVIAPALERGKAEYEAHVQAEAAAYVKRKGAQAAAQPTSIGGAPAGTTSSDEAPVDYAAARGGAFDLARQRVRDRLRAAGELG